MNYILGRMVWSGAEHPAWTAPHAADRIIDLRPLSAQAKQGNAEGHVLPLPGETLIAGAVNETLGGRAKDAVKDLLGIPEALTRALSPVLAELSELTKTLRTSPHPLIAEELATLDALRERVLSMKDKRVIEKQDYTPALTCNLPGMTRSL